MKNPRNGFTEVAQVVASSVSAGIHQNLPSPRKAIHLRKLKNPFLAQYLDGLTSKPKRFYLVAASLLLY